MCYIQNCIIIIEKIFVVFIEIEYSILATNTHMSIIALISKSFTLRYLLHFTTVNCEVDKVVIALATSD